MMADVESCEMRPTAGKSGGGTLVATVRTISQAKTMARVIHISTMVTTVNSVTVCTVIFTVMWVYRDVSGKSGGKLIHVTVVL
jgi:hypothetical protein